MSKAPGLKSPNLVTHYTPEQIQEIKLCMDDPIHWIENYVKIVHPTRGEIPFILYDYQREMVKAFQEERLVCVLMSRQSGKTQMAAVFFLWSAMFHPDQTLMIASNKNSNAMEIIHRIQFTYERLPDWIKPGLMSYTKHSIEFDNGSRILSQATSESTGRGTSLTRLFLDELAFVPKNIQEAMWTSVSPTLATGGSMIIASTPNGDTDIFSQVWRGANTKENESDEVGINGFKPLSVLWSDVPGRDEKFRRQEIAKVGEIKFRQEYECEFISSDPLLIESHILTTLANEVENNKPVALADGIRFYELPKANSTYLVGIDPATGSGEDYTAIQVYKFPELVQVAEFRSNTASPSSVYFNFKKLLRRLCSPENVQVYYSFERNGVGEAFGVLIENDDDFHENVELLSDDSSDKMGFYTTSSNKIRSCITLKEMIEKRSMIIMSPQLIYELKHFVRKRGSYDHQTGATSDLIMATVIVIRMIDQLAQFDEDAYDKLYSDIYDEYNEMENDEMWDTTFNPSDFMLI